MTAAWKGSVDLRSRVHEGKPARPLDPARMGNEGYNNVSEEEDQRGSHVSTRTRQVTPLGFELSGIANEEPSEDHPAFATGGVEGTCHLRDFDLIPRSHGDFPRAEVRNQRRFRYLE